MATRGSASALPPIQQARLVPLSQARAFELFVRRLPDWWPLKQRSVFKERAVSCHCEPEVGGRLFERGSDGSETLWGKVTQLEEPSRIAFRWYPGTSEKLATELDIRFVSEAGGTRVTLEQRGWERLGERAAFVRALFEKSWGPLLDRYVALALASLEAPRAQR